MTSRAKLRSARSPAASPSSRATRGRAHAGVVEGTAERLPVAWEGFAELVDEGDVLYLADGAVRLRVGLRDGGDVVTSVEVGGSVASRQGLNLPNVTVSLPAVSDEDIGLIDAGLEMGVDFFALSFVRRREDLDPVREHLGAPRGAADREDREAAGGRQRRGDHRRGRRDHDRARRPGHRAADRGGAARPEAAPRARRPAPPTITATQMLESMVHSTAPDARRGRRRGERDLRRHRRGDALPGDRGREAPGTGRPDDGLDRPDDRARAALRPLAGRARPRANNQYHAIAFGAVGAVYQLGLKCIVSPTNTGTTAGLISAYRPKAPVLALSPHKEVVRRCRLLWGRPPAPTRSRWTRSA